MRVLRTPDDRFSNLVGFNFSPHYSHVQAGDSDTDTLRVHYLDEGDQDARETIVLLHGEPSWCYLYRKMVGPLTDSGYRVIAPDLVGFGRSDKPASRTDYTYSRHVEWMRSLLFDKLDLDSVTLFCQDWGGLIGLRLVAEHGDRFRRVIAANTGLPTGDAPANEAFLNWQKFSQEAPELPVGTIIELGTLNELGADVAAAYDAPFPDETYKEGARQFPLLVPTSRDDTAHDDNVRAWESLRSFDKPFLCAFGDGDPITRGADKQFIAEIPGASGQPHVTVEGGGHFIQEDRPEALVEVIRAFVGRDAR